MQGILHQQPIARENNLLVFVCKVEMEDSFHKLKVLMTPWMQMTKDRMYRTTLEMGKTRVIRWLLHALKPRDNIPEYDTKNDLQLYINSAVKYEVIGRRVMSEDRQMRTYAAAVVFTIDDATQLEY